MTTDTISQTVLFPDLFEVAPAMRSRMSRVSAADRKLDVPEHAQQALAALHFL